jgi:hypothetical protein
MQLKWTLYYDSDRHKFVAANHKVFESLFFLKKFQKITLSVISKNYISKKCYHRHR